MTIDETEVIYARYRQDADTVLQLIRQLREKQAQIDALKTSTNGHAQPVNRDA